jgi:hypothetical protein
MVYRIDDVTAVSALPALPTDNIGEPGFFTGGSTTGQSPTRVRFWWLNMVQEELINIAQAAGIVFDKTKNDQCITAIKQLISGVASSAVMGTPGVLADGDVAGKLLYYAASQKAPVFVYGTTTVALVTTTVLGTVLRGFLPLLGGNVTGPMDWGSKTVASTVTHRFWSAGPPAEGDAAPDATLAIAGGTPGTVNKGTVALSAGVFDLSGSGEVLAPDATEFDGKQVLSAGVADNRYVRSVPDPNSTNKRITDIWKNSDGRTVSGDGVGSNVLAGLADTSVCGVIPGGYYRKTPLKDGSGKFFLEQHFVLTASDSTAVSFGIAFSDANVVIGLTGTHVGGTGTGTTSRIVNVDNGTVTATGFELDIRYITESGNGGDTVAHPVYISAYGVL